MNACWPDWTIARVASGAEPATPTLAAHLTACVHCREQVAAARDAFATAAYERLPDPLRAFEAQQPPRGVRAARTPAALGLLAACLAAALVLWLPSPGASTRLKGDTGLAVTVRRADRIVLEDVPLERVAPRAGDVVLVRLTGALPPYVLVQARDGVTWRTAFAGATPVDGWLPVDFTVTEGAPSTFRVLRCTTPPGPDAEPPAGCSTQAFAF
jgi:hypothetical protein